MQELRLINKVNHIQQRRFTEVRPRIYQDGDSVTLQFQIGEIQSEMLASDPNFLVLSYTRTMMAFLLFHQEPERVAMIGLGGGSMPKWCYHQLPASDITVIEVSPMVISLREQFCIPEDDDRFRVICGDGADYVAGTDDSPEVLLVDGFDIHGQPPQLCSQGFYEDCYRALAPDGLLVVNLCNPGSQQSIDRIRRSFDTRVLIVVPEDGENKIVFAVKGKRLRIEEEPIDELVKRFRADYMLIPSLVQS
jgi:spermidine synthase